MKRSNTHVSLILALAASSMIAAQTATALDVGGLGSSLGGNIGGLGGDLGASLGGGSRNSEGGGVGASVDGSISAGGSGGTSVGGGLGGIGSSPSGGTSGVGGASAAPGGSAAAGGTDSAAASGRSGAQPGGQSGRTGSSRNISTDARTKGGIAAGGEIASELAELPTKLVPRDEAGAEGPAWMSASVEEVTGSLAPLVGKQGMPQKVVDACHAAIASAALPYGAVAVDVVSSGKGTKTKGGLAAPVEARIVYSVDGRRQVRQARVSCRLNAAGQVVAAL